MDAGGSLLAVLARSCQVDKSVFKAPALRENWPTLALSRAQQGVFSWTDLDDFVGQVQLWEDRQSAPHARLPPQRSVLRAWLQQRGLWDLHKAAGRWHTALPDLLTKRRIDTLQMAHTLQAPLRQLYWALPGASWQAQLLETADALRLEGEEMKHCVATYWRECVEDGSRIFSVCNVASAVAATPQHKLQHTPRVTVQYRLALEQTGYVYQLVQIRGYRNRLPDASAQAASNRLAEALNAPELAEVRNAMGREVQALQYQRQDLEREHAVGYWGAEALLDDTSLAHLAQLVKTVMPPC